MALTAAAPNGIKLIAVFQHFDCSVKSKCFGGRRCTQRLARCTIAERGRTRIRNTVAAVRSDLSIAQRTPDSSLRSREVHIRCKIAGVKHAGAANESSQRVTAVRFDCNAVNVHILNLIGYGVRLAACARIAFGMVCTVCANGRAVRCCGIHGPDISRRAILLKPCFTNTAISYIVGFTHFNLNSRCFVIFFRSVRNWRCTYRHAAEKRHSRQNACQCALEEVFSHFFISFL